MLHAAPHLINAVWEVMSRVCEVTTVVNDAHEDTRSFCYNNQTSAAQGRCIAADEALLYLKYVGCFPIFLHRTDWPATITTDQNLNDNLSTLERIEAVYDTSRGPWGASMLERLAILPNLKRLFLTPAKWTTIVSSTSIGSFDGQNTSSGVPLPLNVTRVGLLRWDQTIPDPDRLSALGIEYLLFPTVPGELSELRELYRICSGAERYCKHTLKVLFCHIPYCEATERDVLLDLIKGEYSTLHSSRLSAKTTLRKHRDTPPPFNKEGSLAGVQSNPFRDWLCEYLRHIPADMLADIPRQWIFPGYMNFHQSPTGSMIAAARLMDSGEWPKLFAMGCTMKLLPSFEPSRILQVQVQ